MSYFQAAGIAAASLAAGFAAFLLIRRCVSHSIDRRVERYQNDLLARHYDEVQNIYQKMRGWRHDYHNHIQTMKAHLALGQLGELGDYLELLDNDLSTVDTVIKTGNVKLDAILNSKLSLIASRKIPLNAKAQVPKELAVNEVDLCVIVGNLLDNALESCERIPDPEKRFIRVYIGVLKRQLYLCVTNSADRSVKKTGL